MGQNIILFIYLNYVMKIMLMAKVRNRYRVYLIYLLLDIPIFGQVSKAGDFPTENIVVSVTHAMRLGVGTRTLILTVQLSTAEP